MSFVSVMNIIIKHPLFRFFASVKFAIPMLLFFALAMIVGTVIESIYGTQFANKVVYHSLWFYLLQIGISISLFFAMLVRIPLQKRLSGFYLVHISLLIIIFGSGVTHFQGIDGTLQLSPKQNVGEVRLSEPMAYVTMGTLQKSISLPSTVFSSDLNKHLDLPNGAKLTFLKYIPFSKTRDVWSPKDRSWAADWSIKNDKFNQKFQLGSEGSPNIESKMDLGLLHLEVVSETLFKNLNQILTHPGHGYVLLNEKKSLIRFVDDPMKGLLFTEDNLKASLRLTKNKKAKMTYFEFIIGEKKYAFFPKFSTYPVSGHLEVDENSDYRLINFQIYGEKNSVYMAPLGNGKIGLIFGKGDQWSSREIDSINDNVQLPWMGFTLKLSSEHRNQVKKIEFIQGTPQKENEKNIAVVSVRVDYEGRSEELWMNNQEVVQSEILGAEFFIGSRQVDLPFKMSLEKFQMQMIPGTNQPASYESFVNVRDPRAEQVPEKSVHIYMNNPYKSDGYTFYQSSYFQDESGQYHSVLSVNKDPGRPIKYAGSILLVLSLILHFLIIYRKIRL